MHIQKALEVVFLSPPHPLLDPFQELKNERLRSAAEELKLSLTTWKFLVLQAADGLLQQISGALWGRIPLGLFPGHSAM